jgi:hypothetical protein
MAVGGAMKRISIICAAAMISLITFSHANAEGRELNGYELKELCEIPKERGSCVGYVNGVVDSMIYENIFCISSSSAHDRFTLIVKNYLSEHPDKLHIHAGILVLDALKEAFPCQNTPSD